MTTSIDGRSIGHLVNGDDFVGVQTLVHRYVEAVIERDGVRWGACWAPDAVWELGPDRRVEGREAIVDLWRSAMAGFTTVFQVVHTGEVRYGATTNEASGRWYINEWFSRANGTAGMLLAHYDDEYERTDDGWLFTRRLLTPHYRGGPDLSGEFMNTRAGLEAQGLTPDV
jgi:hypothetical protein